ncbi:MAG TPA: heme ABC transporter ATP-binding protein [Bdellovibrionales bacterium]|nr:MAG: heme ABC transporter ATP-binding protein [Bdellovibrionales bacterium GWB1_52_6]OFZ04548.1 MAG: heme ABC transporter ATP-binding protein [Bdellovibrionales bacterium GWA1_52_35]HAR43435.1 heme ABC transporter ATP-binding protein [Bdellovibrionales bacterium]HCM39956.1 heme ABC transporter ATP-binding protein [Bdellovibrionales bacterium]
MTSADKAVPAVELRGLSKAFNGFAANTDVNLLVRPGTIHAIIGENGAGKSTAMKLLYGIHKPDKGEIRIRGETKVWKTPAEAIACGIGMVHQHFMLAGPYSALENILLGVESSASAEGRASFIPKFLRPVGRSRAIRQLDEISSQYGLKGIPWDTEVEALPVGVQQRIEILKLLYQNASILILDEPTAVLTPQETVELFMNLKKLAAEGKSILIITHKLKEVMNLSDDVTVLRGGRVVGCRRTPETNIEELAGLMVGRKVNLQVAAPPAPVLGPAVLALKNVSLKTRSVHETGMHRLNDLSFEVRSGEVVGIAGVEGNGQSELLHVLLHPLEFCKSRDGGLSGEINCLGSVTHDARRSLSTKRIRDLGVGIIPEDRHKEGLLLERSVEDNFLLGQETRKPFSVSGFISGGALRAAANVAIEKYDVRPRNLTIEAGNLSGGNQQKLIIAREFEQSPRFIIAAQPTRGVDVGAIEFIHQKILLARTAGAGVLLISSELDEILALSDRILVMYGGKIVARFQRGEATEQALGLYMGGAGSK